MNQGEVDSLAAVLDVPTGTVKEMESRMGGIDVPFDAHDDADDDDFRAAPAGYLKDMRFNPETVYTQSNTEASRDRQLSDALATLDARSRDIVKRRWLDDDKPTLHDLAAEYGVSAERIRQIEKKAMTDMKENLKGMALA